MQPSPGGDPDFINLRRNPALVGLRREVASSIPDGPPRRRLPPPPFVTPPCRSPTSVRRERPGPSSDGSAERALSVVIRTSRPPEPRGEAESRPGEGSGEGRGFGAGRLVGAGPRQMVRPGAIWRGRVPFVATREVGRDLARAVRSGGWRGPASFGASREVGRHLARAVRSGAIWRGPAPFGADR